MNKIYLDKLCEFVLTTYNNYELNNKNFDFNEIIDNVKQNNSLNEKGIFLKFNFVELKSLMPSFDYDQLVLINPLTFNLYGGNIEWYGFLNSLLTVLKDNYIHENNINKKTILELADKTYKKKIIIGNVLDDKIFDSITSSTNIILILIQNNKINIYNKNASTDKVVVMYKYLNEYYPIINWNQKYFNKSNQFIDYLFEQSNGKNDFTQLNNILSNDENKFIKVKSKKNKSKNINNENLDNIFSTQIDSHFKSNYENNDNEYNKENLSDEENTNTNTNINMINTNKNENEKDKYQELVTNEDYAIYISEAVNDTMLGKKKNTVLSDSKKKIKKSKNIFVTTNHDDGANSIQSNPNQQNNNNNSKSNSLVVQEDSSVFNKTEKISKKDIDDINNNLKSTSSLEQIQSYALKLGINIFSGATKTGKPKNKTKSELVTEIKNSLNNL